MLGSVYQQTHELSQQRQSPQLLGSESHRSHLAGARAHRSRAKLVNHSYQWGHPGQAIQGLQPTVQQPPQLGTQTGTGLSLRFQA